MRIKSFNLHPRFCLVNQQDVDESEELHQIAIVCFPETGSELSLAKLTFTVKALLIFTSVVFLFITLYIYYRLSELRETQVSLGFIRHIHNFKKLLIVGQSHNYHFNQPNDFPLLPWNYASRNAVRHCREQLPCISVHCIFLHNGIFRMA